ncbi:late competence protein ComER [Caldalkalibacillus salinus]|uniref:late competence protein ComER n=1 Tax=Caldalkalibacillus salinus TaxID=2803787 RepID=UPI001921D4C6|nr:late competence protein ComER [Caldalkalibacillus salinus]
MQVGFIGTGSMGRILIESFIESKALLPSQIHASNRTFSKVKSLAQTYTGLHAYPSNTRVAQRSDLVFLCIKPLEFKNVIDDIAPYLHEKQLVVSITSPVDIKDLQELLPTKVAKVIPSITNSVQSGASLIMCGDRCTEEDRDALHQLMEKVSEPLWIDEQYTRVSSDIVSCGPAFLSFLLQEFINAAERVTGLPKPQATALASHMLVGMAELISRDRFTLETLQEKVCVPGGVTGAALKVLERECVGVFDKLVLETHRKFKEDAQGVQDTFYEQNRVNK